MRQIDCGHVSSIVLNNCGWYLCGDEKCASHLSPIIKL